MKKIYISAVCDHVLLVIVVMTCHIGGHPQCLDFTAPMSFPSDHNLPFCASYRRDGCCYDTNEIEQQHGRIKALVLADSPELWETCGHHVQAFLCQQCSPYAAHIFEMEILQNQTNPIPRIVPGLCSSTCSDFHVTCKDILDYFIKGAGKQFEEERKRYAAVIHDKAAFCAVNALSDRTYCHPFLMSNPLLFGQRPIEKSSKKGCLCLQPYEEIEPMLSEHPTFLVNAGDFSNKMFVGEQSGRVHIMYPNGTVLQEHFLDLDEIVDVSTQLWDEKGLLGMAFHPKFTDNRKFYLYYSASLNKQDDERFSHKMRVEEWTVSAKSPNLANTTHKRILLDIYGPYWNHNGGQILFGDDSYLYVFVGDGGSGGDPLNHAQNLSSLLGKALRLDVDHPDNVRGKEYSIPPDNPFADGVKGLPEIYAYGLRNPWRCGKDRGDPITGDGKGRIICGDVGQSAYEELDLIEKGANYGWKIREGPVHYCQACEKAEADKLLTEPIHSYSHNVGRSVIGGHFYRGREYSNLNGQYIYGDYGNGQLYSLLYNKETKTWYNRHIQMCTDDLCPSPLTNNYSTVILSFGEDESGEVYMLSARHTSYRSIHGSVYKIVDPFSSDATTMFTPLWRFYTLPSAVLVVYILM